jgi:hypothetical protein
VRSERAASRRHLLYNHRVIARLVLGYVLGVLAFIPHLTKAVDTDHSYKLAILMTSEVPGTLQVYYDTGAGLREADSESVPLETERREYELPIPEGGYHLLRIDPGNQPGRYTIERAVIRRPDGSTYFPIPLAELRPLHQLSLIERTSERLVVESPPGSNDPQLVYALSRPFPLSSRSSDVGLLLARLAGYVFALVLLIGLLERALRPVAPRASRWLQAAAQWSDTHPRGAVLVAAAIATLFATYPILFLNRSLVSPNNGGTGMLYDQAPYVPGSQDPNIEDVRASDVYAMMAAFLPYAKVQRDALVQGEVPLWNRFNGTGRALWGQGQTFLGDPLHWLTFLDADWGQDLKFVAHRFVFAAGVGLVALTAGCSWPAAAMAAALTPFLGFYTFRFNHDAVFAVSYAPWILMAWLWLAGARRRFQMARAAVLLSVTSTLVLLASPPKEAAVVLASCQTVGLLVLLPYRNDATGLWQRLGFAMAAGAAMVAITAPHWVAFLDTLRNSLTVYDRPAAALFSFSAAPQILLGSLNPILLLPPLQIAAVPLLIAAVVSPRQLLRRPAFLACLVVAIGLIAVAFGAIPADWLVHVPLVANIYQVNNVTTTAAIVLLSVVCAVGAESLLAASLWKTGLFTCLVGLTAVWLLRDAAIRAADTPEVWLIGLLLAGAVAVPFSMQAAGRASGEVLPVLSMFALGALLLLPGGLQIETGAPALDQLLSQPRLRADLDATSPAVEAIHRAMNEPARTIGIDTVLRAGSQALYGLEGLGGPDALLSAPYEQLVDAGPIDRPDGPLLAVGWLTVVSAASFDRLAPLLDLLNVGFVLARPERVLPGLTDVPMQGTDRLKPLRRATAWPRAFFTDGVTAYDEPQELLTQVAAHGKPLASVQSTDHQAMEATRGLRASAGNSIPARGYILTGNTTSFVVRASRPGLAVLTETFLPDDFRATLNGRRVPYFRVNHAFKAVAIPSSGDWTVKFEYRPRHWDLSLAIAASGLLLLAGLGVLSRERSPTRR